MQSAIALSTTPFSPPGSLQARRLASIRSNALSVNYNSSFSVFPAEACETIGGDACAAHMYPEVKPLPREANNKPRIGMESFEREYLDYSEDPRTVLLGEACDVLGGEFCDRQYQKGNMQLKRYLHRLLLLNL